VLAWVLSGLVTLPLVLFGLLYTTDLENYRGPISRHVSAALGREIEFGGPITLEPSLTPRLVIEGLAIANPDWASRPALALVEHFKVKAGLLPLLRGELEIKALEFHGVDLLLEEGPGESNNYSFGRPGRRTVLPAIEHMLLYDARLAWLPYEGIAKSVHLRQVRVRKVPRQPVELELATELKGLPLQLSLRAEPGGDSWPWGPWQTTAELELADASLKLTGTVPEPSQWYRGAYRFELEGKSLGKLEPLLGLDLPAWGGYRLGGDIRFNLDDYLVISDLSGEIADAELAGSMRWELGELNTRPGSLQSVLESGEFELQARGVGALWQQEFAFSGKPVRLSLQQVEVTADPGSFLAIHAQASLNDTRLALDMQAPTLAQMVQNQDGPWQNLNLKVMDHAGEFELAGNYRQQPDRHELEGLSLRFGHGTLYGRIALHLAQGRPLPRLEPGGELNLPGLLQLVELELTANVPGGLFPAPLPLLGRDLNVELAGIQARLQPGQPLWLTTEAIIEGAPIQLSLRAETLQQLAARPAGPWRGLELQGKGEGLGFEVAGDVEQPLEARGVDAAFTLEGSDISKLLPLLDLVLPLQGAYSLSGRINHTPEAVLFDDLKVSFGRSDIGGRVQVFPGEERPRVVMELSSEQLYLLELLPAGDTAGAAAAPERVIPDFQLPLQRIREIDAQLRFSARQLRTAVGDLGGIDLALSVQQQRLSLDEFLVRGWAGARVEASGSIDAAQDPPAVGLQLSAREFNYGALLQQAGLVESIEGTLHVTVALTGKGRSAHGFLGSANGNLIVLGKQGSFGSRRLDLWASDLVTTMLSPNWHREDVTQLNCVVARVGIDNGVASADALLVDTNRITIGASGTLDLQSEEINLVFAPRPKSSSLVSLASPVVVTGTLAAPAVEATVLPRRRLAAFGGGVLAGLINPAYLVFTFSQLGSSSSDPCVATVEAAEAAKAEYFENAR
jgi:uncharacterized protein involved in outer membrane biogenesis